MHAKISLLGSTAAINAVITAAVSNGATIASVELSTSDGDSLGGLSLGGNTASPATETASASIPAPTAPSAPIPAPPTSTDSDDEDEGDDTDGSGFDADGLPWDERIHSSNKKRAKDGTWNKRRGGPKGEELAVIEAELRAGLTEAPAAPQAPSAPPPPPMPAAPTAPPPVPPVPPVPQAPSAPPPPVPTAPAPEPAPATPAAQPEQPAAPAPTADMDFPTFMSQIGPKLGEGEGQIGAQYLAEVCQSLGMNTMTDLALKPEQIGPMVQRLAADGRW